MAGGHKTVREEVMEGIALMTFDLPPRNAATAACWDLLTEALDRCARDPAVNVLVLTGAGHHAFVTDPEMADREAVSAHAAAAGRAQDALAAFPKPVIARVRGDCIGAGLLLALHADILIAAQDSAFALSDMQPGRTYPAESIAALLRMVGPQHAKRLMFTSTRIEAQEALRIGLTGLVVADQDLSDTVVNLARDIADSPPEVVQATKRNLNAYFAGP